MIMNTCPFQFGNLLSAEFLEYFMNGFLPSIFSVLFLLEPLLFFLKIFKNLFFIQQVLISYLFYTY